MKKLEFCQLETVEGGGHCSAIKHVAKWSLAFIPLVSILTYEVAACALEGDTNTFP